MSVPYEFQVSDTVNNRLAVSGLLHEISVSAIVTAVDKITQVGTAFSVYFKAALSSGDEATLENLIAVHPGQPYSAPEEVSVETHIGGLGTVVFGVAMSGGPGETIAVERPTSCAAHLQGAFLVFAGFDVDDSGHMALINPLGESTLQDPVSVGASSIRVEAAKAPYYDPALTPWSAAVEFWVDGDLVEQQLIASVDGDTITLSAPLSQGFAAGTSVKLRVGGYTPVYGADGLQGGVRLIGDGTLTIKNELSVSEEMPAGSVLATRLKTSAVAGERKLALNYILRTSCPGH